jgi:hypothetical protein
MSYEMYNPLSVFSSTKRSYEFLVYPNPAKGVAYIRLSGTDSKRDCTASLFSLSGVLIKTWKTASSSNTSDIAISVAEIPAATYLLTVSSCGKSMSKLVAFGD